MKTAIYPGSFDPVTLGHMDIIRRAADHFQQLIVCVMRNAEKPGGLFTLEERAQMISRVTADLPNVEVDISPLLLSDYARQRNATVVVKGLRAMSDYEKEVQMALVNRKLNPQLETMFLASGEQYTYLSSSMVREMALYHVDLTDFLPAEIAEDVMKKIDTRRNEAWQVE